MMEVSLVKDDRLMNLYEVARYLGVSAKTVYRLVARGELKAYRVGALWRFRRDDVDAMLERLASVHEQKADRGEE